jgi:hypothetical protein
MRAESKPDIQTLLRKDWRFRCISSQSCITRALWQPSIIGLKVLIPMISADSSDEFFALEVVILTDHPVTFNIHGARCGTVSVPLMNGSGASRLFGAIAQEGKQETFLTQK